MADSDKELKIKITTAADTAGLKQTHEHLERVKDASAKAGAGFEAGAKNAEHFGLKTTELKKIANELEREFPLAGEAAHAFLNPVAFTFTAAIAIFASAKQALDELNQSLDEAGEKAAEPTFLEAIKARKEALEEGKIKAQEFAERIAALLNPETQYQDAVRDTIQINNELAESRQKLADSQQDFNASLLKAKLQAGLISEAQYYQQLTAMEAKYEQEKLAREQSAHAQEIATLQADLDLARQFQAQDRATAEASRENATKRAGQFAADTKTQATYETALPDMQKTLKALETSLTAKYGNEVFQDAISKNPRFTIDDENIAKFKSLALSVEQMQKALAEVNARLPGEQEGAAAADRAAGRKETQSEATDQRILDRQREIARKDALFAIKFGEDTSASQFKQRGDLGKQPIGGGYTGADVEIVAQLAQQKALFDRHVAGVQALTQQQQLYLDAFEKFAGTSGNYQDRLMKILFTLAGSQTTQDQKLQALEAAIEQIRRNTHQLPQTNVATALGSGG